MDLGQGGHEIPRINGIGCSEGGNDSIFGFLLIAMGFIPETNILRRASCTVSINLTTHALQAHTHAHTHAYAYAHAHVDADTHTHTHTKTALISILRTTANTW
jgi:hypothetical protein